MSKMPPSKPLSLFSQIAREHKAILWVVMALILGLTLVPICLYRIGLLSEIVQTVYHPLARSRPGFWGTFYFFVYLGAVSIVPACVFVAWCWPVRLKVGVPRRSVLLLIGLWIFFGLRVMLPDVADFWDRASFQAKTYEAAPWLPYVKKLDSILLLTLTVQFALAKGKIGVKMQLPFHWLLFFCLAWAITVPMDSHFLYDIWGPL